MVEQRRGSVEIGGRATDSDEKTEREEREKKKKKNTSTAPERSRVVMLCCHGDTGA